MNIIGKKWSGNLNYAGAMYLDLDCDIIDLAIIDIIEDCIKLKYTKKQILGGDFIFKLDWKYIPKRCPFLPTKSRSSIFSRIEKLERLCLIERVDMKSNEMWFRFGGRYEDFINAPESSKTDSGKNRVQQDGLTESSTVDSPESSTVDSNRDYTFRDYTFRDYTAEGIRARGKEEIKKIEKVKTEVEETEKVAPKKIFTPEELQTYEGLKRALQSLDGDTPGNRIEAWKYYIEHIRGDYFMSSWEHLSDYRPIEPERVMREWVMKADWSLVFGVKYNKISNWINTEFRIKNQENKKNYSLITPAQITDQAVRKYDELGNPIV